MNFNSILTNIGAFLSGKKRKINRKNNFEKDKSFFFPILRNFTDGDIFIKKSVNFPLGDDIGIFIVKRLQNNDQITLDYILHVHLEQYGISKETIAGLARANLEYNRIKIEGIEDPDTEDIMVKISSPLGWVCGILLDKDLLNSIKKKLGGEMIIGVISSGLLLLTTPNSSYEQEFESIVESIDYQETVPLNPACYEWKDGELILKRLLK